jgi:hypothetical protein
MSAATPRFFMRAHRMSPKMPASVTPMASATAMQPSGIASMAARVEIGFDHDSGVAQVLARRDEAQRERAPDERGWPGFSGACRASRRCAGPSSAAAS